MKDAIALRDFRHAEYEFTRGQPLTLPADQYRDWKEAGLVGPPSAAKRPPGAKTAR